MHSRPVTNIPHGSVTGFDQASVYIVVVASFIMMDDFLAMVLVVADIVPLCLFSFAPDVGCAFERRRVSTVSQTQHRRIIHSRNVKARYYTNGSDDKNVTPRPHSATALLMCAVA